MKSSRSIARCATAVAVLIGGTAVLFAQEPSPTPETVGFGAADIAGEYWSGGWGHSVRLTLDANGTYEAQWQRGCWDGEREKGTFTMSEGLVWIELPDGKPHTMTEGTRYVPVKWGERRFLIPPDQLVEFRSDILEGFDSDNISGYGMESCFRRTVDEDKPVSGVPVAPGRWQDYFYGIIAKSIEATVTSVYTETGRYDKLHYATLDKGTADGLRRSMEFAVQLSPDDTRDAQINRSVYVTRVFEDHVEGRISPSGTKPEVKVGDTVSVSFCDTDRGETLADIPAEQASAKATNTSNQ